MIRIRASLEIGFAVDGCGLTVRRRERSACLVSGREGAQSLGHADETLARDAERRVGGPRDAAADDERVDLSRVIIRFRVGARVEPGASAPAFVYYRSSNLVTSALYTTKLAAAPP